MNPLVLIDQFAARGKAEKRVAKKVVDRAEYMRRAVERVEKASGLKYPPYYVEPTLPLSASTVEYGSAGVLYARVIPTSTEAGLSIVVQFTAPLIAFGGKGTIEAVAAHEFTHYLDLVRRLSNVGVVSDERATTLYESSHADSERTLDPKLVFTDKALVRLVKKKFRDGLVDDSLNGKVTKNWIEKGLPTRRVAPEDNVVRLRVGDVVTARLDPKVVERVRSLEGRKAR
ncbi:MAG: hypothetical protein HYU03_03445 [Thaumarchaeota archaeon]|nr:hypothetical protein [Nitrososphaerota archaeon]MBI3116308.1 hypothetical protein [Nitrososphaerota archaeon]MCS4539729.1 hypothetical protein [Nitrososphaerota archaeon]